MQGLITCRVLSHAGFDHMQGLVTQHAALNAKHMQLILHCHQQCMPQLSTADRTGRVSVMSISISVSVKALNWVLVPAVH